MRQILKLQSCEKVGRVEREMDHCNKAPLLGSCLEAITFSGTQDSEDLLHPDEPSHNFRALTSVDRRILYS